MTCGKLTKLVGLGVIVGDAAEFPDVDVRTRAQNAVPKLLLEPGHDRQRDDHRHHADDHADRGEERDDGDERLLALGQQIAEGDVELERNSCSYQLQLSASAISSEPSAAQATPFPHQRKQDHVANRLAVRQQHHQPVDADAFAGGRRQPIFERADIVLVHGVRFEVPSARSFSCASKRRRCSSGSFSSLKALATSKPAMYSSNRSTVSGSSGFCFDSGDTSVGKS